MKNGKYNIGNRLHALSNLAFFCACVVAGLIAGGCRSSRSMVQETETIAHNEFNTSEKDESVHSEANDTICQRDSIKGSAVERGRIDIERDSTGRPVVIIWAINSDFSAEATTETLEKGIFDLRGSSNHAEASGSMDSVTEKKEEAAQEVKVGISLECLVACIIIVITIVFYAGEYIYRLWKKKQGR